jgi:hypothetical protein
LQGDVAARTLAAGSSDSSADEGRLTGAGSQSGPVTVLDRGGIPGFFPGRRKSKTAQQSPDRQERQPEGAGERGEPDAQAAGSLAGSLRSKETVATATSTATFEDSTDVCVVPLVVTKAYRSAVARRAAVALDTAPVISAPAAGVNWTAEASRASSRTRTKPSRPEMVDPTMAGLSFAQPKGGLAKAHKAQVQHVYVRSSRPDDGTQAAAKGAGYGCGGLAGVHVTAREKLDAARTARRKARQIESDEDEDDDAEGAGVGDPAAGGRADPWSALAGTQRSRAETTLDRGGVTGFFPLGGRRKSLPKRAQPGV